jgi:NADH-quinone oxidoreductase subunit N
VNPFPEIQTEFLTGAVRFVIPEVILLGVACLLFVQAVILPARWLSVMLGLGGIIAAAIVALVFDVRGSEVAAFWEIGAKADAPRTLASIDPTGAASFVRWLALASGFLFVLMCWRELKWDTAGEYVACVLVLTTGVSLVGRVNDLVSLFLSLEMVSIPTYVLLYLPSRSRESQESAVKYFLLSVLSSGVLLFGFSYLYGVAGSTNLSAIASTLTTAHKTEVSQLVLVGIVMVIAGLGFRIAAVPFHFYAPDVYQGAPTGVVAQLAFVPKVAGFVALAKVLGLLDPFSATGYELPFDAARTLIPLTLWVLAAVTMTFGNVLALLQNNLKRMFAYSGIAHTGYMLLGLVVASALPAATDPLSPPIQSGIDSVLFYLAAYGLMTIGAFAVLMYLSGCDREAVTVDDLAGLGQTRPFAAALLTLFLISMIGLPLTAGFAGKLQLFLGAFDAVAPSGSKSMYRVLVAVAAINAAIAAVYYLRTIAAMYQRTSLHPETIPARGYFAMCAALLCAVGTIFFGLYPQPLAKFARKSAPLEDTRPAPAPRPLASN